VLAAYRKSIDNIDAALIHMLAERFRITQAVGEYKAEAGLPASDPTARRARSSACARWRSTPTSTPSSARSSSAS
jgi:chorismate mutase